VFAPALGPNIFPSVLRRGCNPREASLRAVNLLPVRGGNPSNINSHNSNVSPSRSSSIHQGSSGRNSSSGSRTPILDHLTSFETKPHHRHLRTNPGAGVPELRPNRGSAGPKSSAQFLVVQPPTPAGLEAGLTRAP